MEIYIGRNGKQRGPFSLGQVKRFLAEGKVKPDDGAWHEGLEDWIPVSELAEAVSPDVKAASTISKRGVQPLRRIDHHLHRPRRNIFPVACLVIGLGSLVAALFIFQSDQPKPEIANEDPSASGRHREPPPQNEFEDTVRNESLARAEKVATLQRESLEVTSTEGAKSSEDVLRRELKSIKNPIVPPTPTIVGLWETKDGNIRVHIIDDGTLTAGYNINNGRNVGVVFARGTWQKRAGHDNSWTGRLKVDEAGQKQAGIHNMLLGKGDTALSQMMRFHLVFEKYGTVFSLPFKNRMSMLGPADAGSELGFRYQLDRLE